MPQSKDALVEIVAQLAQRPGHEAVRVGVSRLLSDWLGAQVSTLAHEVRVIEARGRIDALLGRTIFEFKSNLPRERKDALEELSRYLPEREKSTKSRFVAVVTDGADWEAFELRDGAPYSLKTHRTNAAKPDETLAWIDGAVAALPELKPDALNIKAELGGESIAFLRAMDQLSKAWAAVADHPTASLQRQLWARLLNLVYGRDIEQTSLWLQHTYLVIVAKAIAANVLRVSTDDAESVLTGKEFRNARVFGAVESDFFDWVLLAPGGADLVTKIVAHVGRFRWPDVEADVLKIVYESLIDAEQRHGLGEYYTPDWLAAKIVRNAVQNPVEARVLDPACGSGAFLFHAVRLFLREAEEAGMAPAQLASEATRHIAGIDIHPVAAIIARVTYLIALMPALGKRAGEISIPVYLGDALQLDVRSNFDQQELRIVVPPPPGQTLPASNGTKNGRPPTWEQGATHLAFPDVLCREASLFDKLIEHMREASHRNDKPAAFQKGAQLILEQHYRRDPTDAEAHALADLAATYKTFDDLRRAGRNSIWTYVARNLSRPLAYGEWASVLIGNPPWVAFRHMSEELQKRFKILAEQLDIYVGGKLATQNDLCAVFLAQTSKLYLRSNGRLAMVLPLAALSRGQFAKLRSGQFHGRSIAFDEAWTMDESVQPLFPVPSCVVFGRRRAVGKALPDKVTAFSGRLPFRDAPETIADERLTVTKNAQAPSSAKVDEEERKSPYQSAFRQGATLVPRMLCLVERKQMGRLGAAADMPLVISRRGALDKKPWRDLPGIEHAVESPFLRPVLLGESILPFRVWRSFEGVVPVDASGTMIDSAAAARHGFSGLSAWMRNAETAWRQNQESDLSLVGRWNFHNELGAQFPIAPIRVVYAASGSHPAACVVRDGSSAVEHKLYWAPTETEEEAYYLAAILGSEAARARVEHLQSRGQFGARDFDKVMFTLPIPRFDPENKTHTSLTAAGAEAERLAAALDIPQTIPFQRARASVRAALREAKVAPRIDALVQELLG
ncbi:MAG TPA: hypothetical protein DHW63_02745 [Hyphomonadaceae bacterium]|nr:hypothetical protein [Hyphomonadaceae bacterium]